MAFNLIDSLKRRVSVHSSSAIRNCQILSLSLQEPERIVKIVI